MIRAFSLSDLERILQIERQSFPKSPYDWATFVNLHYLYPGTFIVYVEPNPDTEERQVWGYIVFSQEGHVISIAVHPDKRRKGIGTKLLERAMKTTPAGKLWAEVRKSNHGAQAFYHQMGFQTVGVVPNYYGNEDALIVQWTSPETH